MRPCMGSMHTLHGPTHARMQQSPARTPFCMHTCKRAKLSCMPILRARMALSHAAITCNACKIACSHACGHAWVARNSFMLAGWGARTHALGPCWGACQITWHACHVLMPRTHAVHAFRTWSLLCPCVCDAHTGAMHFFRVCVVSMPHVLQSLLTLSVDSVNSFG